MEDKVLEAGHTDKIVEATVKVSEVPAADAFITPVTDTENQAANPDDSTARKLMTDSWLWEALGLAQFVICIVAIVGILIVYDGQPLKTWNSRANLSINTIIAILQQVAMMGMTIPLINCMHQAKWLWFAGEERPLSEFLEMDNAKGTIGSIRLLLKPGRRWLVSLAAVVTLLTIIWRPFTQQAVNYPLQPVTAFSTSGNSWIEYTLALQPPDTPNPDYPLDEHLKLRIQQGIWSSTPYDASNIVNCEGQSCSFDDFQSLGVFANSSDISNQVVTTIVPADVYNNTLFTVPGGPSILQIPSVGHPKYRTTQCQNNVQLNITTDLLPYGSSAAGSWRYSIYPQLILHFQMLFVVQDQACNLNATAIDSNIYWSANTYNVAGWGANTDGSLSLQTLASDVDSWNVTTAETLAQQGGYANISYQTELGPIVVAQYETPVISQYLATIFNGSASSRLMGNNTFDDESPAAILAFLYELMNTSTVAQPDFTAYTISTDSVWQHMMSPFVNFMNGGLLDLGDIDTLLTRLPPPQNQAGILTGYYTNTITIVHVSWPWMTLPFLLTVLVFILLVGTMHQTKKRKLQLWRSSTVPVLRAGNGANEKDGVVLGTNREMEDQTRNVSIALKRDDAGQWRVFTKDLATVANKTMLRRNAARTVYMKSVKKQVDGVKKKVVNEAVDKVEGFAENVFDNLFSSR